MDDTDKKIKEILNKEIDIPKHFDDAIKNALYTPKGRQAVSEYKRYLEHKKNRFRKVAVTTIASISTFSTICVAGFAYDRVWYEPETYSYEDVKQALNAGVSEEMKKDLISEDDAKKIAVEAASKLGYEGALVESVELKNDISDNDVAYYNIKAKHNTNDSLSFRINAVTSEIDSYSNQNILDYLNSLSITNISTEQALIYADDILNLLKYDKENYKLSDINNNNNFISGKNYNMWSVTYFKTYNDICNPYEKINITFAVSENKPIVYEVYNVKQDNFENDLINIDQKTSIDIAVAKEKEFTDNEISQVEVELGIRKLNAFVYMLENDIDITNNSEKLYTENISRKVWIVTVKHKELDFSILNNLSLYKQLDKSYFIDCTTGKIIGGQLLINPVKNTNLIKNISY